MKLGILAFALAIIPALANTHPGTLPHGTRDKKSEREDHLRKVTARSQSHESTGSAIDWAGAEKRDLLAKGPPTGLCEMVSHAPLRTGYETLLTSYTDN
jgi:hypothetical protein